MGNEVWDMYTFVRDRLQGAGMAPDRIAHTYVPYAATDVKVLVPSGAEIAAFRVRATRGAAVAHWTLHHYKPYIASIDEGVRLLKQQVTAFLTNCPGTTVVLGGYSQGAMVVHQAVKKLSPALRRGIGGSLLLGDGDRVPHSAARQFGSATLGQGIRSYFQNPGDIASAGATASICDTNDIVCDFGITNAINSAWHGNRVHSSYRRGSAYRKAAHYVAAAILSRMSHTLDVSVDGAGSIGGRGISCPDDCEQVFLQQTTVNLSARPDVGWVFSGWRGDCSGTGRCTVEMGEDRSATAVFDRRRVERARISWDTDDTDVILHVWDSDGNHAWYGADDGVPDAELSSDVTTGFGPEVFSDFLDPSSRRFTYGLCYYSDHDNGPTTVSVKVTDPDGTVHSSSDYLAGGGSYVLLGSSPAGGGYDPGRLVLTPMPGRHISSSLMRARLRRLRPASKMWLVVGLAVVCVTGPQGSRAAFPGNDGRIAFVKQHRIWSMNPDGSNRHVLLRQRGADSPRYSADGKRIVFDRRLGHGHYAIYAMRSDGRRVHRLTPKGRSQLLARVLTRR